MAQWFIQRPQEHSHPAEIRVAEFLRSLDDKWTVVWGFYYTDRKKVEREADSLVIGPAGGALVLEVKNTLPRWFSNSGQWEGERDNPVNQLMDEWNAVVRKVKEKGIRIWIAKALCVPGQEAPVDQESVQGIQRSLLVLGDDLADWLRRVWLRLLGDRVRFPVPNQTRDELLACVGVSVGECSSDVFVDHTEDLFRRQFRGRFELLERLRDNRQLLVRGGPGCGKTWYAIEQAMRYASQGKEVLFLVYNLALTEQVRRLIAMRRLETGSVRVVGWEELFLELAAAGGELTPPDEGGVEVLRDFYEEKLPDRIRSLLDDPEARKAWPRFDALVADEAQDHDTRWKEGESKGWWEVYRALLREEGEAPASVFYDPDQRPPFRNPGRFDAGDLAIGWSQPCHVTLATGLRYTRPLLMFLQRHRHPAINGLLDSLGRADNLPEGPEPEVHSIGGGQDPLEWIEEIIQRWRKDGLCRPDEVMILHKESAVEESFLGSKRVIAGCNLRDVLEAGEGDLRHTSINKAKGLDAKAVILIGCPPMSEEVADFEAYSWLIGASRARQLLAIVESEGKSGRSLRM